MRGLYAIVDTLTLERRGLDVVDFARRVLAACPAALQLRAKDRSARDTLSLLRALRGPCSEAGVPLFANDRPDLARLARCDGVHVGQEDLSVEDVRRFAPELRVGVSTHDLSQLARSLELAPDYVAFGPVFTTASKLRPDPVVGIEGLARARELVGARVPLVAIGGIDVARAADIAPLCDAAAVIGALVPSGGLAAVEETARALQRVLGGG